MYYQISLTSATGISGSEFDVFVDCRESLIIMLREMILDYYWHKDVWYEYTFCISGIWSFELDLTDKNYFKKINYIDNFYIADEYDNDIIKFILDGLVKDGFIKEYTNKARFPDYESDGSIIIEDDEIIDVDEDILMINIARYIENIPILKRIPEIPDNLTAEIKYIRLLFDRKNSSYTEAVILDRDEIVKFLSEKEQSQEVIDKALKSQYENGEYYDYLYTINHCTDFP